MEISSWTSLFKLTGQGNFVYLCGWLRGEGRGEGGGGGGRSKTDLSTWENCYLWDFDHNSIQNIITLGDAVENCYLPHNFLKDWPNKLNITTDVVLPWIYSAITKIKHI